MNTEFDADKSIYLQIAENIEDGILKDLDMCISGPNDISHTHRLR